MEVILTIIHAGLFGFNTIRRNEFCMCTGAFTLDLPWKEMCQVGWPYLRPIHITATLTAIDVSNRLHHSLWKCWQFCRCRTLWIALSKKILEDKSPFCGDMDTHFLDFWGCLLWVSKPEWAALFALGEGVCVTCSLRFTSTVTPADLLAASMAVEPISPTYQWAGIGGARNWDLLHLRRTLYDWAMPTRHVNGSKWWITFWCWCHCYRKLIGNKWSSNTSYNIWPFPGYQFIKRDLCALS